MEDMATDLNNAQYLKMTAAPVPGLVIKLAIPTVISMLVTAIYNTADTFFVSRLGTSASGAVGIVFSIMAIFQAIGFTFGTGAGSMISRKLGARESRLQAGMPSSFSGLRQALSSPFTDFRPRRFHVSSVLPRPSCPMQLCDVSFSAHRSCAHLLS